MKIGIDGSRAFIKKRTGIEEYSYQVIKHLREELKNHQVILYLRKNQTVDFELPKNWEMKIINWPRFWTQLGLSLEMLLHPVDLLFIPAHTIPFIHPKNSVVVVHGLEYEICPEGYSNWEKFYMRFSIKNSCRWASKIISVSQNTKKDLMKLYKVSEEKIDVVYEGYSMRQGTWNMEQIDTKYQILNTKYLLFVGRIEERKNITNIIEAFEILKDKYQIPHKLVLAGKPGYGYEKVQSQKSKVKSQKDIIELGYVSDEEKWQLLKAADVFVFPTKYEGFGIPILEAQSIGCSVVASNNSSVSEVVGSSALLVDCTDPADIADKIWKLLSDQMLKNDIINKGLENVKRFSWEKCATEIAKLLNC